MLTDPSRQVGDVAAEAPHLPISRSLIAVIGIDNYTHHVSLTNLAIPFNTAECARASLSDAQIDQMMMMPVWYQVLEESMKGNNDTCRRGQPDRLPIATPPGC